MSHQRPLFLLMLHFSRIGPLSGDDATSAVAYRTWLSDALFAAAPAEGQKGSASATFSAGFDVGELVRLDCHWASRMPDPSCGLALRAWLPAGRRSGRRA